MNQILQNKKKFLKLKFISSQYPILLFIQNFNRKKDLKNWQKTGKKIFLKMTKGTELRFY